MVVKNLKWTTCRSASQLTAEQTRLEDVRPVGRYALQPIWADGHSTGLYTYDYLRANCECPDHRIKN